MFVWDVFRFPFCFPSWRGIKVSGWVEVPFKLHALIKVVDCRCILGEESGVDQIVPVMTSWREKWALRKPLSVPSLLILSRVWMVAAAEAGSIFLSFSRRPLCQTVTWLLWDRGAWSLAIFNVSSKDQYLFPCTVSFAETSLIYIKIFEMRWENGSPLGSPFDIMLQTIEPSLQVEKNLWGDL